jgi:hypothetical protein
MKVHQEADPRRWQSLEDFEALYTITGRIDEPALAIHLKCRTVAQHEPWGCVLTTMHPGPHVGVSNIQLAAKGMFVITDWTRTIPAGDVARSIERRPHARTPP